jgi:hypothetical protein
MNIETLKYPIGIFIKPETITQVVLNAWIEDIQSFPNRLIEAVSMLSKNQLDTPYTIVPTVT